MSTHSVRTLLASLLAFSAPGIAEAQTRPTDEYLATSYAPLVYVHSNEDAFPSSVKDYLNQTALYFEGEEVLGVGSMPQQSPADQPPQNGVSPSADASGWYLRIPDGSGEEVRKGNTPTRDSYVEATCYVHVKDVSSKYVDVQYWFFYPFNGAISIGNAGTHDGDWEHVTVRVHLAKNNPIAGIFYARHGSEGRWVRGKDMPIVNHFDSGFPNNPSRIEVYSAKRSHASYSTPGEHDRLGAKYTKWIGIEVANDFTDKGYKWETWRDLVILKDEPKDDEGHPWVQFGGQWGGSMNSSGTVFGSTSPQGPAFKSTWAGEPAGESTYGCEGCEEDLTWNQVVLKRGYLGILGRQPDPGGASDYLDKLDNGMSVAKFALALWNSTEFAEQRSSLSSTEMTKSLYQGILGRDPDSTGAAYTSKQVDKGQDAGAQRAAEMLQSREAHARNEIPHAF